MVLESARQQGFLGASLEAKVLLHVGDPVVAEQLAALQQVRAHPHGWHRMQHAGDADERISMIAAVWSAFGNALCWALQDPSGFLCWLTHRWFRGECCSGRGLS